MVDSIKNSPGTVYDTETLKGFSRSVSELQILLLSLVLLYFFIPTRPITNPDAMIAIMVVYAIFVMAYRYLNNQASTSRWKIAIETWGMVAFITAILWHTGMAQSPLLNLYLLVIIACAIMLGKMMTLLEVILVGCCYFYLVYNSHSSGISEAQSIAVLLAKFAPFLLVAYVTSMLASDIFSTKRQLALLSHTDDLTGLLNMRAFDLILDKEILRAKRHQQPFTILTIDVDSIKAININHGDAAGNRLIKVIASSILDCVRTSDILARYGGDEFVVLMTQTSTEHARMIAERIRAAAHNTSFDIHGHRVATTVSIGIASFPNSVLKAGDVFKKADIALHKSKQSGRNQVTFYEQELELISAPA